MFYRKLNDQRLMYVRYSQLCGFLSRQLKDWPDQPARVLSRQLRDWPDQPARFYEQINEDWPDQPVRVSEQTIEGLT